MLTLFSATEYQLDDPGPGDDVLHFQHGQHRHDVPGPGGHNDDGADHGDDDDHLAPLHSVLQILQSRDLCSVQEY